MPRTVVLRTSRRLRHESDSLCRRAAAAHAATRALCEAIAQLTRSSRLRWPLVLRRGGTDPVAIEVLTADPGTWYCIACWAPACGVDSPKGRLELRSLARAFPQEATGGRPVFDAARCDRPDHQGHRARLCVRAVP